MLTASLSALIPSLLILAMPAHAATEPEAGGSTTIEDGTPAAGETTPSSGEERAARRGGGRSGGRAPAMAGGPARQGPAVAGRAAAPAREIGRSAPSAARSSGERGQGGQGGEHSRPPGASQGGGQGGQGGEHSRPPGASQGSGPHSRPPSATGPQASNTARAVSHARPPASGAHARPPANGTRPPAHAARGGGPRPPRHVVHQRPGLPPRWAPDYHRYHLRGVPHYAPRYWASGIFIYNPPPPRHRVVVINSAGERVSDAEPTRAVDRNQALSVGFKGGTYASGYERAGGYADFGLGLNVRYRPVEAVGLELSWMHHSDTFDENAERNQDPISASVQLFAFPWTRVSPYALVGISATPRAMQDTLGQQFEYAQADVLAGPHVGLGLELAVGEKAAINFEGRFLSYIDRQPDDIALPGAFQGTMGLNFYF